MCNIFMLLGMFLCYLMSALLFLHENMFQWVRNLEGRLVKVNFPQEPDSGLNLNTDKMEHLEGEQHF